MSGQSGVKVVSREARVWGVVALGGSFSKPAGGGWLVSAEFAARRVVGVLYRVNLLRNLLACRFGSHCTIVWKRRGMRDHL